MRTEVARALELEANRFDIEPEITAKLLRAGHTIIERPVHFEPRSRAQGKKIGWRDGVQGHLGPLQAPLALMEARGGSTHAAPRARIAAGLALVAVLGVAAYGIVKNTRAVGGSDSSCYGLMAAAFAEWQWQPTFDLAKEAPWPDAARTLAPAGFVPSTVSRRRRLSRLCGGILDRAGTVRLARRSRRHLRREPARRRCAGVVDVRCGAPIRGACRGRRRRVCRRHDSRLAVPGRAADERRPRRGHLDGGHCRCCAARAIEGLGVGRPDRPRPADPSEPGTIGRRRCGMARRRDHPAARLDEDAGADRARVRAGVGALRRAAARAECGPVRPPASVWIRSAGRTVRAARTFRSTRHTTRRPSGKRNWHSRCSASWRWSSRRDTRVRQSGLLCSSACRSQWSTSSIARFPSGGTCAFSFRH